MKLEDGWWVVGLEPMTLLLEREEMPIELELIGIATNLWWEIVARIILYSNKLYLNMVIIETNIWKKKGALELVQFFV